MLLVVTIILLLSCSTTRATTDELHACKEQNNLAGLEHDVTLAKQALDKLQGKVLNFTADHEEHDERRIADGTNFQSAVDTMCMTISYADVQRFNYFGCAKADDSQYYKVTCFFKS